jgi:hypothetical protein
VLIADNTYTGGTSISGSIAGNVTDNGIFPWPRLRYGTTWRAGLTMRAVGADEHLQLPEPDPGVHRLLAGAGDLADPQPVRTGR